MMVLWSMPGASATVVTAIFPPGKFAKKTPKAIGTNNKGSNRLAMPKYNKNKAMTSIKILPGEFAISPNAVISNNLFRISIQDDRIFQD